MTRITETLTAILGPDRVRREAPLALLTTFRVGGPAEWLVETRSDDEVRAVVGLARREHVPLTILGGGSNVLVSDSGVRGIVMRPRGGEVANVAPDTVRAGAGITINGLVRWTIGRGLAGLEAWAGTPGTVGGAVCGNAHFQGRLISEQVLKVRVITPEGELAELDTSVMEFGYDRSRLQRTGEVLLSADFRVAAGDPVALRQTARESLSYRKQTQPLHAPSAGCVFQNPDWPAERLPEEVPASAGALIDRAGLKGRRIGGASVSSIHANFIVNDGTASAADIRALIDECRSAVLDRFGIGLREEIVCLGVF